MVNYESNKLYYCSMAFGLPKRSLNLSILCEWSWHASDRTPSQDLAMGQRALRNSDSLPLVGAYLCGEKIPSSYKKQLEQLLLIKFSLSLFQYQQSNRLRRFWDVCVCVGGGQTKILFLVFIKPIKACFFSSCTELVVSFRPRSS